MQRALPRPAPAFSRLRAAASAAPLCASVPCAEPYVPEPAAVRRLALGAPAPQVAEHVVVGVASKRASAAAPVSGVFPAVALGARPARAEAEPLSRPPFSSKPVLEMAAPEAYRAWPDEVHRPVLAAGGAWRSCDAEVEVGVKTSCRPVAAGMRGAVGTVPPTPPPSTRKTPARVQH